jgi:hypothetical protein
MWIEKDEVSIGDVQHLSPPRMPLSTESSGFEQHSSLESPAPFLLKKRNFDHRQAKWAIGHQTTYVIYLTGGIETETVSSSTDHMISQAKCGPVASCGSSSSEWHLVRLQT